MMATATRMSDCHCHRIIAHTLLHDISCSTIFLCTNVRSSVKFGERNVSSVSRVCALVASVGSHKSHVCS